MLYDIFFHDDFDGRASAAVVLDFLRSRGDDIERYSPVNHDIGPRWSKLKFKNPTIIVDFYYHPKAKFWFDHHPTAFQKEEWRRKFRPNKFHNWKVNYLSCCRLVLDALTKRFGYKPPLHLKTLAKWLDIIDAAKFKSVAEAFDLNEPAIQIWEYIERESKKNHPLSWLIKSLAAKSLQEAARDRRIQKGVKRAKIERSRLLTFYKKNLEVCGNVSVIDLTRSKNGGPKFISYYLYPNVLYHLNLKRYNGGTYHVGWGVNLIKRSKNKVHIGRFLRKRFGGGGHKNAGGAEFKSRREADRALREIIEYVNKDK